MSKNIKAIVIAILILTSVLSTYILLGKFPYTGAQTLIGITQGADINVPYNHKYGILGYAFTRNYYKNGEIAESRIESFNNVRFALSVFLTIGVWGIAGLIIYKSFIGNKEITS
ncbi:hypothetical protein IQ247_09405 [Plectonema cf. radiosum LEGE 06105]|uniref:Uncharacterized protein n=1 Tax=Plectonema cf. radiosum LEGE 06105 TaxID=945769 RepID=A0A8J7JU11_9CYAN|nr:hypothetical protein [Plectonema radiosum]MBE9212905.1 hypothetical protein [Plectonema cf. radiosum LEGE 06105]